jgi:hypothetical protein
MASITTLFKSPLSQQNQTYNLASTSFSNVIENLHSLSLTTTGKQHGKLLFVDTNNEKLMHQLNIFDKYTSVSSPINTFQINFTQIDGLDFLGVISYPTTPSICVFAKNLANWSNDDMVLLHVNMTNLEKNSEEDSGKVTHAFAAKLNNLPEVPAPAPPEVYPPEPTPPAEPAPIGDPLEATE